MSVIVGGYIREAVDELNDKNFSEIRNMEDYLLSLANDFDSGDMVEKLEDGLVIPSDDIIKKYHDYYIDEYEEDSFWHNLITNLGKRDFERGATKRERDVVEKNDGWLTDVIDKYYKKYEKEFDQHGIERLEINRIDDELKRWHFVKDCLMKSKRKIFFHKREVWWCSIGKNIGFEQNGKGEEFTRPVVIVKRLSLDTCLVVPLTVSNKRKNVFSIGFLKDENRESFAMVEQFRLIDARRLRKKIGVLNKKYFNELIDFTKKVNFG